MKRVSQNKAILGGGSLFETKYFRDLTVNKINTPYGQVYYFSFNGCTFINRHGPQKNIPPHKINYKANLFALKKLGVKYIFAFNSVGSLRKSIIPGTFVLPHDYIEFHPLTFFNYKRVHVTPILSWTIRKFFIKILKKLNIKFRAKGVYFESQGPRLETKAEVEVIKKFATVVGMTMGKEATLAKELNLEYASICSVDNFANGIVKTKLTQSKIEKMYFKNREIMEKIVKEIIKLNL